LTILGIIAAVKTKQPYYLAGLPIQISANCYSLCYAVFPDCKLQCTCSAVVKSLLLVLCLIRRTLSFIARCVQDMLVERPRPKSSTMDNNNVATVPVKERAGMSAEGTSC
jgi:hypothetical protein